MDKRLNKIYDAYKDHSVTFNQSVTKHLGLVPAEILLKCGSQKLPCIIYSSSLCNAKVLINLTKKQLGLIKKKHFKVTIQLTYFDTTEKKNIRFFIHSKVTDIADYDLGKKELYFFLIQFSKRVPDIYINMLGSHILKRLNMHKRAEERFVLNKDLYLSANEKHQEIFIFVAGAGKRCILTELSMFSAKVILVGSMKQLDEGINAMLLVKSIDLDGTGEMVGCIERVEVISEYESLLTVIIKFDQELIPPVYKLWISDYLEMVYRKRSGIQVKP